MTIATATITNDILAGRLDADLASIAKAVRTRQKEVRRTSAVVTIASLDVGDTVRITGGLRPAYLTGVTGEVVKTNTTRVVVTIDDTPLARRFAGHTVTVPANCVEAV